MHLRAAFAVLLCLALACVGKTGGETIDFPVAAAGPAGAVAGQPHVCSGDGAEIVISRATLHVGALYLDQSGSVSGGQATGCYLTGTYVAEETSALDVDALSPLLQPFPARAHGITEPPSLIGQVWLTRGEVNGITAADDAKPILVVAGTATQNGATFPFSGSITIGSKRQPLGGASAGGATICKQRIVTPIAAPLTIAAVGGLLLRVDPCRFFTNVDFSSLPFDVASGTFQFVDDPRSPDYTQPSQNLYGNLHSVGPYALSWTSDL